MESTTDTAAAPQVDLTDFIAGGWFVARAVKRPEYSSPELMPEKIISASESVGRILQAYWGMAIDRNRQKLLDFGIGEDRHPDFAAWSRTNTDLGHPNTFYKLSKARQFVERFMKGSEEVLILGVALHKDLVPNFLEESKQVVYDPVRETYVHSDYATPRVLKLNDHPIPGDILGFELLGYEAGFWSWLRNSMEKYAHTDLGITPNQYGLIDSYEDAKRIHEWIDAEGSAHAEPIPYKPWLVISYPPVSTAPPVPVTDTTDTDSHGEGEDKAADSETENATP